jgi:hypothetical protein
MTSLEVVMRCSLELIDKDMTCTCLSTKLLVLRKLRLEGILEWNATVWKVDHNYSIHSSW